MLKGFNIEWFKPFNFSTLQPFNFLTFKPLNGISNSQPEIDFQIKFIFHP